VDCLANKGAGGLCWIQCWREVLPSASGGKQRSLMLVYIEGSV